MTYYIDNLPPDATMYIAEMEQPPKGYTCEDIIDGEAYFYSWKDFPFKGIMLSQPDEMIKIKLPYPLGAKVG